MRSGTSAGVDSHAPNNIISALIAEAFQRQGLQLPQERVASLSMHLRTQLVANAGFITIMPNSMLKFCSRQWVSSLALSLVMSPSSRSSIEP